MTRITQRMIDLYNNRKESEDWINIDEKVMLTPGKMALVFTGLQDGHRVVVELGWDMVDRMATYHAVASWSPISKSLMTVIVVDTPKRDNLTVTMTVTVQEPDGEGWKTYLCFRPEVSRSSYTPVR